jgi:hypothetical protein
MTTFLDAVGLAETIGQMATHGIDVVLAEP